MLDIAAIMESLRERLTAAEPQVALVSSWKQSILYLEILTRLKSLPLSSLSLSLSHPLCLQRALFVMEALLHSDIPDTLSHSLTHTLSHSLIHSLTHSLTHSPTHSPTDSLTPSPGSSIDYLFRTPPAKTVTYDEDYASMAAIPQSSSNYSHSYSSSSGGSYNSSSAHRNRSVSLSVLVVVVTSSHLQSLSVELLTNLHQWRLERQREEASS